MASMKQLVGSLIFQKKANSLVSMDFTQSRLVEGYSYEHTQSSDYDDFDENDVLAYHITVPDVTTRVFIAFGIAVSGTCFFEAFEDKGVEAEFDVSGGDTIAPVITNRNKSRASVLATAITVAPTITAADVAARGYSRWCGPGYSMPLVNPSRWLILKQDTQYLFRLTSRSNNNEGTLIINWDEYPSM